MTNKTVPDMTGKTFTRWTVLSMVPASPSNKNRRMMCECICSCGTKRLIPPWSLTTELTKSCGCLKSELAKSKTMENSANWRGGKHIDDGGYINIYLPFHHKAKSNGYVKEHVLVMEQKLGRQLLKGEEVHHKNGQKSDNRSENLELWVVSQPCGQRASDLVKWAKELILRYENTTYE